MNQRTSFFTIIICLYFSQGLPSGLLAHALPALMREYGVSLQWIGMMKILALPWFLKFLWSPYIDQYWQRKNWILLFQGCVIPLMLLISFMQPQLLFSDYLLPLLIILLLLNTFSASQDIATDGLVVEQRQNNDLGYANCIQVAAYKVGLILGGTALLILLDNIGWHYSFQLFAALLAIALLPLVFLNHTHSSAKPAVTRKNCASIKQALLGYLTQKDSWKWLIIVATYKIADELGSSMLKPMLVDYGFSLADIGYLSTTSSLCGIAGAALSGLLFSRISIGSALIGFSLLQTLGLGLLGLIPSIIQHPEWVYAIMMIEQFVDGISTVTLFSAMMMHCRTGLEGTDYTIQNSIHVMGAGTGSILSGFLASALGYEWHYCAVVCIGLAILALNFKLYKSVSYGN